MPGILSEEREALRDVNQRISAIERRLKNARAARDSYLDYLRSKYPSWLPSSIPPIGTSQFVEESDIFSQLETSHHFWDMNRETTRRFGEIGGRLYNAIPPSGPLLQSDLPRMRRRLDEINGQLRLLREHRSILPSEEYIRSTMPPPEPIVRENRDLMEIQERLSSMQFSSPPVLDVSPERITELKKKEEMEKLMQDLREGRIPSVLGPPPIPPVNVPSYSVEAVERQSILPPTLPPPSVNPPSSSLPPPSVNPPSSSLPTIDERSGGGPRVQFESPAKEEPKKVEEPKPDPPKSNYQQILSLLSNPTEKSVEQKKKKAGSTRSFDDVFGKSKPSADPLKPISLSKPKTMSMAFEADDSDDDFFQ